MTNQIKNEFESSYLYLSMAAWFNNAKYDGMAKWMKIQSHEEWLHGMKFFDHMASRSVRIILPPLAMIKTDWPASYDLWNHAAAHEKTITKSIESLCELSTTLKDHGSIPLLMRFLEEQIEEESHIGKIVDRINMVREDASGMIFMDDKLGKRMA